MMVGEFKVKAIKKGKLWQDNYGEFQNYALQLEGLGEPVKLSLPVPVIEDPEIGDTLYGLLTEEKVNDRVYFNLQLKKRSADWERQQDIHAQVGLKIAVEVWLRQGGDPQAYDNIETEAIHFAKLIENVKKGII